MWFGLMPSLVAQYRLFPCKWSSLAIADLVWLSPFFVANFWSRRAIVFAYLDQIIAVLNIFTRKERIVHAQMHYRWFTLHGILDIVGFEMTRSFILVLGTMGFLINSLASQAWLIQPISLFSIYGLSFMIMLVNLDLAQVAFILLDKKWQ
jgi:apolipoprotein N-acyltransferase